MKKIILFLSISVGCLAIGKNKDYSNYHMSINKAEELFFVHKQVDSALYYYDQVFNDYDFIFVKDLINAAQIAAFSNRPYQHYIEQGFEHGLKINHLKEYQLLKKIYTNSSKNKKLLEVYDINRKKYLNKIDFKYLDLIYKLAIKDQQNKHSKSSNSTYRKQVYEITQSIKDSIKKRGFPGDRMIGISDSTIFKEINKPHKDLYNQRKQDKRLWYMISDEKYLNAKHTMVIFLHNPCSYHKYKDLLYTEMLKGNIHPRDIGLLHDHVYSYRQTMRAGCDNKKNQVYQLNEFANYPKDIILEKTNEMRKELFIVSIDVDKRKKEYEKAYGFKLFSGFWNCR